MNRCVNMFPELWLAEQPKTTHFQGPNCGNAYYVYTNRGA
jgi:hypothetical protein